MQLVVILRQIMQRRIALGVGVLLAGVVAFYVTQAAPAKTSWTADSQVFVDSGSSAIANSTVMLDSLGERAGVYANMMTSASVLGDVGRAAGIPANEIAVSGPVGATGLRQKRSPSARGGPYALQLDVTAPNPIIDITATAPTRESALALAGGAAQGLAHYVDQLVMSQNIPLDRQVAIRQLGQPNANPVPSGVSTMYVVPIAIAFFVFWCMLVLWTDRFLEAWRGGGSLPSVPKNGAGVPAPADGRPITVFAAEPPGAATGMRAETNGGSEHSPARAFVTGRRRGVQSTPTSNGNGHDNRNGNGNGNGASEKVPADALSQRSAHKTHSGSGQDKASSR